MTGPSSPIARDARDRVARLLGLGLPHPLRDLELEFPAKVDLNARADIRIVDGQRDVRYRLCDEEGNLLFDAEGKEYFEARGPNGVVVVTPAIPEDVTFTILATQTDTDGELVLEGALSRPISIQVGINENLEVTFVPGPGQESSGGRLVASHGDRATVAISATQEGVSYHLVIDPPLLGSPVETVIGNKGVVHIATGPLTANVTIRVRAFRTTETNIAADLTSVLSVVVRPDPSVSVQTAPVVDYGTTGRFVIASPQSNATYRLYRREIAPEEYLPEGTRSFAGPGGSARRSRAGRAAAVNRSGPVVEVPVDDGRTIRIQPPSRITDWERLDGFVPDAAFEMNGAEAIGTSASLTEDTLFVVRATNKGDLETLALDQILAVLVRPNPAPEVSAEPTTVKAGSRCRLIVRGTQKGVEYQLRVAPEGTPVGRPGFHFGDRTIDRVRVEVDLEVEGNTDERLLLPTGPIEATTNFDVVATKTITGLAKVLTDVAVITLEVPPVEPPVEPPPADARPVGPRPIRPATDRRAARKAAAEKGTARRSRTRPEPAGMAPSPTRPTRRPAKTARIAKPAEASKAVKAIPAEAAKPVEAAEAATMPTEAKQSRKAKASTRAKAPKKADPSKTSKASKEAKASKTVKVAKTGTASKVAKAAKAAKAAKIKVTGTGKAATSSGKEGRARPTGAGKTRSRPSAAAGATAAAKSKRIAKPTGDTGEVRKHRRPKS